MTGLDSLVGKRVAAVKPGTITLTIVFDDGTELEVDASTDWDVGVLQWEIFERGPA